MNYKNIIKFLPNAEKRFYFIRQIAFQENASTFAKLLKTCADDVNALEAIIKGLQDDQRYASNGDRDDRFGADSDPKDLREKEKALQKFILSLSDIKTPERKPKP